MKYYLTIKRFINGIFNWIAKNIKKVLFFLLILFVIVYLVLVIFNIKHDEIAIFAINSIGTIVSLWLVNLFIESEKNKIVVNVFLISFFILMYKLLVPLPSDYSKTQIKILNGINNNIMGYIDLDFPLTEINSLHREGYMIFSRIARWYSSENQEEIKKTERGELEFCEKFSFDLVELSFWNWLYEKNSMHWQENRNFYYGINSGGGGVQRKINAEKKVYNYPSNVLRNELKGNVFISTSSIFFIADIKLPYGTKVTIDRSSPFPHPRRIKIQDKYFELQISIYSIGSAEVNDVTFLGKKLKSKIPSLASCWESNSVVEFSCNYTGIWARLFRWTPSAINRRKWVGEVINKFKYDFDWIIIKPELEKAITYSDRKIWFPCLVYK